MQENPTIGEHSWVKLKENITGNDPDHENKHEDTLDPISIPIQTLHINEPEGLTPTLVYIPLAISNLRNKDTQRLIEVMALHDSGCAQPVLRTDMIQEMSRQGIPVHLVPTPLKFTVVTAAGVKHTPDGLARIQITFNRGTTNEISYPVTVMVYKHLSQQILARPGFHRITIQNF